MGSVAQIGGADGKVFNNLKTLLFRPSYTLHFFFEFSIVSKCQSGVVNPELIV